MCDRKIDPFDVIRLITEAEHHFNNLCFKIRTLASTWLLATFAGVGFLLSRDFEFVIGKETIVVLVCWAGALGISVLWILDLQVYQKLLDAWFDARKQLEDKVPDLPNMRERIKATQPGGRATNLLKIYYIVTCSAPMVFAVIVTAAMANAARGRNSRWLLMSSALILVALNVSIHFLSPGRHSERREKSP
jgi:hypothetical protein